MTPLCYKEYEMFQEGDLIIELRSRLVIPKKISLSTYGDRKAKYISNIIIMSFCMNGRKPSDKFI